MSQDTDGAHEQESGSAPERRIRKPRSMRIDLVQVEQARIRLGLPEGTDAAAVIRASVARAAGAPDAAGGRDVPVGTGTGNYRLLSPHR